MDLAVPPPTQKQGTMNSINLKSNPRDRVFWKRNARRAWFTAMAVAVAEGVKHFLFGGVL